MTIWNLIKQFMKDTEAANNIIFAESAWQRAKQLEKDILAEHWIDLDEKRVQSLSAKAEFDALVESADNLIDEKERKIKLLEADMASLLRAGNEMRKNLSPFVGSAIGSPLYRWDEAVKQTTAIGAVQLLRQAEMAKEMVTKIDRLEADLTFGVFPGDLSYEEWVAAGRPYEPEKKANRPGVEPER
jgi:hypothetical protein